MNGKRVFAFAVAILGCLLTGSAGAGIISLNFATGKNATDHSLADESGPVGLEPVEASLWNNVTGTSAGTSANALAPIALTDELGQTTTARLTFRAPGTWSPSDSAPTLLRGYLDDQNEGNVPVINVTDVPYASYDLIIYFASDSSIKFGPPLVNGTWYTCSDDGIGTPGAYADMWGDCTVRTEIVLGKNAIRINGLSGAVYPTLAIQGTRFGAPDCRASIAGFQIIETEAEPPAAPQTISINFTNDADSALTMPQGVVTVPAARWSSPATIGAKNGTLSQISLSDGTSTAASASWNAATTWFNPNAPIGSLLKGYLDDGGTGAEITLSAIPFTSYDLYIIISSDSLNTAGNFRPIAINGTSYTFNAYKTVAGSGNFTFIQSALSSSLMEGKNYLALRNLSGNALTVKGGVKSGDYRGSIAAIQIVNRGAPVTFVELYTRAVTESGAWHADAWTNAIGTPGLPWTDGVPASLSIASGQTLTLAAPATAAYITASGSGTLASAGADAILTASDTISFSSDPDATLTVTASLATPASLTHTGTGTLALGGDLSACTGPILNTGGTLLLTETAITTASTRLTATGGTLAYTVAEGATATFPGTISTPGIFNKLGGGTLSLSGINPGRSVLSIPEGTLIIEPTGQWNTGGYLALQNAVRVYGGTLVFRKNWNYGVNNALGELGNNSHYVSVDGGRLVVEADTVNSGRGFRFGAGGAILEVAEGVTFSKGAGSTGSQNLIANYAADATLTLAGAGTGVFNDTIPQDGTNGGTTAMGVVITGSDWSMNGTYTYLQGTRVAPGGVLRGTGTFRGSPVTVGGTLETGATIESVIFETGSAIRVDESRILTIESAITLADTVDVVLSEAPETGTFIAFATLPEGVTIGRGSFTVSGFSGAAKYSVRQDGRTLSVGFTPGTIISLY